MIDPRHLRDQVIVPVLSYLGPKYASPAAVDLLLGTCAQESAMGRYLVQIRGPARGIYQMEPATARDIDDNYLRHHRELRDLVVALRVPASPVAIAEQMAGNLYYATAMARVFYWRLPDALPATLEGQAALWKRRYNTPAGRGTVAEYLAHWAEFVAPWHDFRGAS